MGAIRRICVSSVMPIFRRLTRLLDNFLNRKIESVRIAFLPPQNETELAGEECSNSSS